MEKRKDKQIKLNGLEEGGNMGRLYIKKFKDLTLQQLIDSAHEEALYIDGKKEVRRRGYIGMEDKVIFISNYEYLNKAESVEEFIKGYIDETPREKMKERYLEVMDLIAEFREILSEQGPNMQADLDRIANQLDYKLKPGLVRQIKYYLYNNMDLDNLKPKMFREIHRAITYWNIHNNYNRKFVVYLDLDDAFYRTQKADKLSTWGKPEVENMIKTLLQTEAEILFVTPTVKMRYSSPELNNKLKAEDLEPVISEIDIDLSDKITYLKESNKDIAFRPRVIKVFGHKSSTRNEVGPYSPILKRDNWDAINWHYNDLLFQLKSKSDAKCYQDAFDEVEDERFYGRYNWYLQNYQDISTGNTYKPYMGDTAVYHGYRTSYPKVNAELIRFERKLGGLRKKTDVEEVELGIIILRSKIRRLYLAGKKQEALDLFKMYEYLQSIQSREYGLDNQTGFNPEMG